MFVNGAEKYEFSQDNLDNNLVVLKHRIMRNQKVEKLEKKKLHVRYELSDGRNVKKLEETLHVYLRANRVQFVKNQAFDSGHQIMLTVTPGQPTPLGRFALHAVQTCGDPVDYKLVSVHVGPQVYNEETLKELIEIQVAKTRKFNFTQTDIDSNLVNITAVPAKMRSWSEQMQLTFMAYSRSLKSTQGETSKINFHVSFGSYPYAAILKNVPLEVEEGGKQRLGSGNLDASNILLKLPESEVEVGSKIKLGIVYRILEYPKFGKLYKIDKINKKRKQLVNEPIIKGPPEIDPKTKMPVYPTLHKNQFFTFSDLENRIIVYEHLGGENFHDSVVLKVDLPDKKNIDLGEVFKFDFKISPVNDNPPVWESDRIHKVTQNTDTPMKQILEVSDKDNPPTDSLKFIIQRKPSNGIITTSEMLIQNSASYSLPEFTYEQVLNESIIFHNTGSIESGFFIFTITDGKYNLTNKLTQINVEELKFSAGANDKNETLIKLDQELNFDKSSGAIEHRIVEKTLNLTLNGDKSKVTCAVKQEPRFGKLVLKNEVEHFEGKTGGQIGGKFEEKIGEKVGAKVGEKNGDKPGEKPQEHSFETVSIGNGSYIPLKTLAEKSVSKLIYKLKRTPKVKPGKKFGYDIVVFECNYEMAQFDPIKISLKYMVKSRVEFSNSVTLPQLGYRRRLSILDFENVHEGQTFKIRKTESSGFGLNRLEAPKVLKLAKNYTVLPPNWKSDKIKWKKWEEFTLEDVKTGLLFIWTKDTRAKSEDIEFDVNWAGRPSTIWRQKVHTSFIVEYIDRELKQIEAILDPSTVKNTKNPNSEQFDITSISPKIEIDNSTEPVPVARPPTRSKMQNSLPKLIKRHSKTILYFVFAIFLIAIMLWLAIYKYGPKQIVVDSEEMATMMPFKPGNISQKVSMPGAEVRIAPAMNSPSVRFQNIPHCVVTEVVKHTEDEYDEIEASNYSDEDEEKVVQKMAPSESNMSRGGASQGGMLDDYNANDDSATRLPEQSSEVGYGALGFISPKSPHGGTFFTDDHEDGEELPMPEMQEETTTDSPRVNNQSRSEEDYLDAQDGGSSSRNADPNLNKLSNQQYWF